MRPTTTPFALLRRFSNPGRDRRGPAGTTRSAAMSWWRGALLATLVAAVTSAIHAQTLPAISAQTLPATGAQPDTARPDATETPDIDSQVHQLRHALVRLPIAASLACLLALRPRRRGTPKRQPPVIQTQIILAIVGAVVMLVVGSSLARAFGIVGAAGLVRYRAKIEDPKDAGVMLSTLAVGRMTGPTAIPGTTGVPRRVDRSALSMVVAASVMGLPHPTRNTMLLYVVLFATPA